MANGLIENIRMYQGRAPLWPLHRWRLVNSALALGLPLPDLVEPLGGDDRILHLEIWDGEAVLTELPIEADAPIAVTSALGVHRGYPHKIAARAWLEAARATSRAAGADDALLFDADGHLVEATRWAVGWWEGESLRFPPLALRGLPSVARARLAEVVRGGIGEGLAGRDELAARALVACSAAQGLRSIDMLDGTPIGINRRTTAIAKRFWERTGA